MLREARLIFLRTNNFFIHNIIIYSRKIVRKYLFHKYVQWLFISGPPDHQLAFWDKAVI